MKTEYVLNESPQVGLWWCDTHNRPATHLAKRSHGKSNPHCDPALGGIMLPCKCRIKITEPVSAKDKLLAESGLMLHEAQEALHVLAQDIEEAFPARAEAAEQLASRCRAVIAKINEHRKYMRIRVEP